LLIFLSATEPFDFSSDRVESTVLRPRGFDIQASKFCPKQDTLTGKFCPPGQDFISKGGSSLSIYKKGVLMKRFIKFLTLAVVLLCSMALAQASTITPFSITNIVIDSNTINNPFTVPESGTYKAVIQDFSPSNAFDTLVFAITTTSPLGFEGIVNGAGGSGMFTFVGDPMVNYVANIAAVTGASGIGLFGAEVSLIPIPPSLLLLGSGLLGLVVIRRRRS